MSKRISINIPIYKRLNLLKRCISRIKEYTSYGNYEIVVIDDGSQDKKLTGYAKSEADILITHKENEGIAKSRRDGISASNGYYICEMDSDTIVTPNWLTKLLDALENRWLSKNHQVVIASPIMAHQIGYFIEHGEINNFGVIQVGEVGTACTLFRRSLIDLIGNFDPKLYNLWSDKDFCLRVSKYKDRFEKDPKIVIDPQIAVFHHGWIDPETGNMTEEYSKNTRSLPELNDIEHKKRSLQSMELIKSRWDVEHPDMDRLKKNLRRKDRWQNE